MQRIAEFARVSEARFHSDWRQKASPCLGEAPPVSSVSLPLRATRGSAGYDFFSPAAFSLGAGQSVLIPTGIRALIDEGWFLALFPRSGLGFRYRLQLDNSVGVIDSDYAFSDNEGHILLRMTNDSREGRTLEIRAGEAVAQGVFLPYGITRDDCAGGVRNGGFGSTTAG